MHHRMAIINIETHGSLYLLLGNINGEINGT
jgi:hypothetical protein